MRKNVQINVNSQTNEIFKSNGIIGISSENLQGKIIFKPVPFVDGACRMYIEGYGSILMDKQEDCYVLDILSSLLITPSIDICFKITEPEKESGIPIFATEIMHFRVLDTIEDSAEIPEQYPTWIETFDSKIAEIDNLIKSGEVAVENIKDMTEEYNQNAIEKTEKFNENYEDKKTLIDQVYEDTVDIKNTARDFVSAYTFTTFEVDLEDGGLYVNNEESLGNMGFEINYETGELEVKI